jgi:transposase
MAIITIGIDLAKNVFAVHGVDESGKRALVRPNVKRNALPELIVKLPPCLIGIEACSGAHHWAREFAKSGHTLRLMAPKFVAPYRACLARRERMMQPMLPLFAKSSPDPTCASFPSSPRNSSRA